MTTRAKRILLHHFCNPADKGAYLRTVYGACGHVYAAFISLRLHFHQSHTGQSLEACEFGWKEN